MALADYSPLVTALKNRAGGISTARINLKTGPVAGMFWAGLAALNFAVLGASAKFVSENGIHPFEAAFFRSLFCTILLLPLFYWRGPSFAQTRQLKMYGLRVLLSFASMTSWFYALSIVPFSELTAIGFLSPLFSTLGAIVILGEVVRGRRWAALLVGFMGAILTLHPNGATANFGYTIAFISTMLNGVIGPLVKQLTAEDDADKIVFLSNALLTPLSLLPALPFWTWPSWHMMPVLMLLGLAAVLGHVSLVRALKAADASLVFTFDFTRLPLSFAIAWVVFHERPDVWTYLGAIIIFGAAAYVVRRESQISHERMLVRIGRQTAPLSLTPLRYLD